MATLAPALALLLLTYVSPKTTSPYLYLVFLAVSIPFSVLSFRANSKITEIINSNEVRHSVSPEADKEVRSARARGRLRR